MNMASRRPTVSKIKDYGIIGDCRAAALVSRYGSIDFLCWPRFDSPSIFAALLDWEKGGYWSIAPTVSFQSQRAYIHDTNVLETSFECASGQAALTDLMPVSSEEYKRQNLVPDHELIRQLRCDEGEMQFNIEFCPRPDWGRRFARIRNCGVLGLQFAVGRGVYWLRSSIPLKISESDAVAVVRLKRGDVLHFSLSYAEEAPITLPALGDCTRAAIDRSIAWWQEWTSRNSYHGVYRDAVTRSALTLKLLAYAPSGAIAAAPTTSLPERVGDNLNWDYRYCWLRDASLTVRALLGLGYMEEAESFATWLLHATRLTQPELRVLYNVFGELAPREKELTYLKGYLDSRPVRIGNAARQQFQLDVYGEVMDATAQYAQHAGRFDRTTQKVLIGFGKYVAKNWDSADEGIWEPRSGRRNNTHSRLMCWTALDRLLRLNDKGLVQDVPRKFLIRERDRIKQQIESRSWNQELQTYVSVLDGKDVDATLLRLSWYGFERADSARMRSTYAKIRAKLNPADSLLYRYERKPPEGAFGVCGFWAVEHLALGGGTLDEARAMFEQILPYQNDLGLFAEEVDPASGDALGNFPQAFTHIGLISAALTLAERERGEEHPAVQFGSDVKSSPTEARG